ncbi:MAG: S41 family peptidase [Bacteroidaceae bacterium]|nr:S41 family peptidase [Bacteroidaceae bacterium]
MKVRRPLAIALATLCTAPLLAQGVSKESEMQMRKLQMAEYMINNYYVDTLQESKLVEDAITGMLKQLDPHSSYSTPKEVKKMNEPLEGSFDGIGVQFNVVDDTLLVIQPVVGGPSERVGILAGDRIVKVDTTTIAGVKMDKDNLMRLLRGPKGTRVVLGIVRRGVEGINYFTVKRDKIPVNTVDAAYMIAPEIGYLRFSSFGATTHTEVLEALAKLKSLGMKKLILDLQENGGGYLKAAVDIAGEFLGNDKLVVYTEGRGMKRENFRASRGGVFEDGEMCVLIDQFSASASEILSGALQDWERATIIGRRSYGKGLVQHPIELPDGSMIRLTVAHYYTPSGRCVQKPYKRGNREAYELDIINRYNSGELINADSIKALPENLRYKTLITGKTVYGGGGIMPDIFVPLDTTVNYSYYNKLSAKSIIINKSLKFVDKNRNRLKKEFTSFDKFLKEYEVPKSLIDEIVEEGKKVGVEPKDEAEFNKILPTIKLQLKALVARDIWDMSEYFHIINQKDNSIRKALEVLQSNNL